VRGPGQGALNPLGSVGVPGEAGAGATGALGVAPPFAGPLSEPGVGDEPTRPLFGRAGFGVDPGMLPLPTLLGALPGT